MGADITVEEERLALAKTGRVLNVPAEFGATKPVLAALTDESPVPQPKKKAAKIDLEEPLADSGEEDSSDSSSDRSSVDVVEADAEEADMLDRMNQAMETMLVTGKAILHPRPSRLGRGVHCDALQEEATLEYRLPPQGGRIRALEPPHMRQVQGVVVGGAGAVLRAPVSHREA